MNLKSIILCFLALISICCFSQEDSIGYILEIRGDKVYLDLKAGNVEIGNKFKVIKEGGYFTHPVTGEKIKEEDIVISQLAIIDVKSNYSIATAFPAESISLLERGAKVVRIKNDTGQPEIFRKSVAIQPLQVTNTFGFLGIYAGDALTELFLKSNLFRVFDRQTQGLQADKIVLDSGGVLTESQLMLFSSNIKADYYITGTMFEPYVVDLSTGTQVRTIFNAAEKGKMIPAYNNPKTNLISEYVPQETVIKPLKAIVKIALRVVDVKTGEIKVLCTEMQESKGKGDINLEGGLLNGLKIRGGMASFQNTITGKATELALGNLTNYINDYFNGKITDNTYTGNIIEDEANGILITDLVEKDEQGKIKLISKPDTIYRAILNKGENMKLKHKKYLNVYLMPDESQTITDDHGKANKIGYLRITNSTLDKSEGDLIFKDNFNGSNLNQDRIYLKLKSLWSTVFFISRIPIVKIYPANELGITEKGITYTGLGYMLNYFVGFYGYVGYGNTIVNTGSKSLLNTYYGGFGLTKSIGRNTNIGAGLTLQYSKVKVIDFEWIQTFDMLGSTRLANNLTIVYGCSFPHGGQSSILINIGGGYSF